MMVLRTVFAFWLLICLNSGLTAQELKLGGSLAVGANWESTVHFDNSLATATTKVIGSSGYGIAGEMAYHVDAFSVAVRPELLLQRGTLRYRSAMDGGMQLTRRIYPLALLLPVRISRSYGHQRWKPHLGAGGGLLFDLSPQEAGPRPEPILPYVEIAVGAEVALRKFTLRPELTVRHGTGELFRPNNSGVAGLGGQRWAYVAVGVTVLR